MNIRLVISGRSYDKAAQAPETLELAAGATVDDALAALAELLGEEGRLPDSCLVAVAGRHLGTIANHPAEPLRDGDEVVLFSPVAGG
ncbi:MAG: MoaD/ThiS family protein [Pirellulaceae bacterium]